MRYAETKPAGRRLTALVAVGLFHVVLVYVLVHGLVRRIVEVVQPPLETRIIEEAKPTPPEKPPPPVPKLAAPSPSFIPLPEVQVQVQVPVQVPVQAPRITAVTPVQPVGPGLGPGPGPAGPLAGPGPVAASPVRTPPVVRAASCEKPPYPAASLRAGETGIVTLSFLIDVTGKVLESKVERSSGYRRLDEAARNGLELCKFTPGSVDGKPERAWARMQYDWKID
jgi:periplasmic protein TonB